MEADPTRMCELLVGVPRGFPEASRKRGVGLLLSV